MLKLQAGERDHPANSWGWVANSVASAQAFPDKESLHARWILLIKVFEDHKSLEILVETSDRLEKISVT